VAIVKLKDGKKIRNLTSLSRLEIKTAISWHYRTKLSVAPKRGSPRAILRNASLKGGQALSTSYLKFVALSTRRRPLIAEQQLAGKN